jgi:hypothetical protein
VPRGGAGVEPRPNKVGAVNLADEAEEEEAARKKAEHARKKAEEEEAARMKAEAEEAATAQGADAAVPAVRQVQGRGLLQQGVPGAPPHTHTHMQRAAPEPAPARTDPLPRACPPRSPPLDRGVEGRAQARVRARAGRGGHRADPAGREGGCALGICYEKTGEYARAIALH